MGDIVVFEIGLNTNISNQLFDYKITFVKSQRKNTNSKVDFVLKNQFETFFLKRFLVYTEHEFKYIFCQIRIIGDHNFYLKRHKFNQIQRLKKEKHIMFIKITVLLLYKRYNSNV